MICSDCAGSTMLTAIGRCSNCGRMTRSISLDLCEPCSQQLDECQICREPMNTHGTTSGPSQPGVFFVRKGEKDNGCTASLKLGEEIHITLPEDRYSYRQWEIKDYTRGNLTVTDRGQFTPDPGDYQYGTRTIVFTAASKGQATIELHEVHQHGGGASSNLWKCTVNVK